MLDAATSTPIMEFRNVRKIYGIGDARVQALAGVDLKIYAGEFIAIMGASGSGKSTAMNIIGCLDRATDGEYLFTALASRGSTTTASPCCAAIIWALSFRASIFCREPRPARMSSCLSFTEE